MTATLFGVIRPTVPTLAGISAVLLFTAGIALWVPAWHASRLDPVEALRRE
jgi:ABC-type antimicrobial peptide transport system permease subunit